MKNDKCPRVERARAWACALMLVGLAAVLAGAAAVAGPGAHGPNGEHLDAAAAAGGPAPAAGPRIEAKSELFELVARLGGGELSILIDRFASNEPVLKAEVEVASGALKAKAVFHADIGDYVVDDPAMLKLLATPGEHALLITIVAGEESDLLDAVLHSSVEAARGLDHNAEFGHGKSWLPSWARYLGAAVLLAGLLAWAWRRKAATKRFAKFSGEQA